MKWMIKLWSKILLWGCFCFLISQVTQTFAADQRIQILTGTDYAPYADPKLPNGGVVTALVSRVFEEMGHDVHIVYYPWKRAYQRVLDVKSDATFPYAKNVERAALFYYSRPINAINIRVFEAKNANNKFVTLEDMVDATYCQPLGYQTEPELTDMISRGVLTRFEGTDMESCFNTLGLGRVDFVVANDLVAWASANRAFDGNAENIIMGAKKPLRQAFEYLIVSKQHPQGKTLIASFNDAYEKLLKNGVLTKIWTDALGKFATPAM